MTRSPRPFGGDGGAGRIPERTHKRFPPPGGPLLVPVGSRRAALAALALYPACRPRALVAQRVARGLVRLAGARALPGRRTGWRAPMEPAAWEALAGRLESVAGRWDALAALERPQPGAEGFSLLPLAGGRPLAFAKVRREADPVRSEAAALERVAASGPTGFLAPRLAWVGEVDGWHAIVVEAVIEGPHRPAMDVDPEAVAEEVAGALEGLPRPPGIPAGWRPMHGDFTPWNLRRRSDGRLVLVDWEAAGWGPPGSDAVLFRSVRAALGGKPAGRVPEAWTPAVERWRREVRGRGEDPRDRRLAAELERALAGMAGRSDPGGESG